jgi:hypothetical protein
VPLDAKRIIDYNYMVTIIDTMSKKPQTISGLYGLMRTMNLEVIHEAKEFGKDEWQGNYKTLERIPKEWIGEYLVKRAVDLNLQKVVNREALKAIGNESIHGIQMLFQFETQTIPQLSFPEVAKDKAVATLMFENRAEAVGHRLNWLVQKGAFAVPGKVNFFSAGCYKLEFAGEILTGVAHCSGIAGIIPDHLKGFITKKFHLVDNHLDHMAKVELKPSEHYLWKFFLDDAPFRQKMIQKGKKFRELHKIADNVNIDMEAKRTRFAKVAVQESDEICKDVGKRAKAQNLEKARLKLVERQEARKKARTCKMDVAP